MRIRRLSSFALALLALSLTPASAAAEVVPGEVVVKYRADVERPDRARVQGRTGVGRPERLPGGARELDILDGESVGETVAELREDPRVAYAVPNHVAHASGFVPNDPGLGGAAGWQNLQWNFVGPASVNAPEAWETARRAGAPGGRGVTVAVLDTGVAYRTAGRYRRAPDLSSRRIVRGYDFVSDDPYPDDENGHGTHVAGTIAEGTNNGIGVTGLAYGARIMPLRVLDSDGAGDAVAIGRGIRFAARNGAQVINLSLEFGADVRAAEIPEVVSAVRYAHARGAVVVGAAGNEGDRTVAYPARTGQVISVGATTERMCRAEYSNTGRGLDIVAPGGGTDAVTTTAEDGARCAPGNAGRDIYQQTYVRLRRVFGLPPGYQGTSMAAPHVSATAALLIASRRLGRRPTPAAIEERLERRARDLGPVGYDSAYGAGMLDAAAALRR